MPIVVAIDPGEVYSACAIFKMWKGEARDPVLIAGLRPETKDLFEWFDQWQGKKPIVCFEDFRLYPNYKRHSTGTTVRNLDAHRMNEMKTSKAIGIIEFGIERYGFQSFKCLKKDWSQPITDGLIKRLGYWEHYVLSANRHIHDAVGIGLYFIYVVGILNGGTMQKRKRILTPKWKEILST